MNSELERIKTLIDYDILDSPPEEMFDDITYVASTICKMPIALISLLDKDRQFFKSNYGTNTRETPIEYSFCKIAVEETNDIFIIEDARKDSRFSNNPLVVNDPNIVSYYGVPLNSKSGVPYGTLCVIDREIKILNSEQKEVLRKLSKQVEYLIELRKNNKLLNDYQSKIESYSKNMEEFAYLASHDLKTPVRGIESFTKLLEKKNETLWDEKDSKYLNFIKDSTSKMNSLIKDLLEYSKTGFDRKSTEIFNLKNLILEIFNSFTIDINDNNPILIIDKIPNINSSKTAFSILFTNLIDNAIKYQEKGNVPVIKIDFKETPGKMIFSIEDNGIGINKEYFELIFKPFKRLHSDKEYQGNGLGLAACAKIVDSLNGTIVIDSVQGKGSVFTITIPKI